MLYWWGKEKFMRKPSGVKVGWPTLDFGVFDQHIQPVSDGWTGGFSSCQKQIQHRGHQVVVNKLRLW